MLKRKIKAIILLITLFFVSAISIIILQNLNYSDEFFKVVQTSTNLTQTNITVENVKKEILKLFKDKKDNLDGLFSYMPDTLPLQFESINLSISINKLDYHNYYNLNDKLLNTKIDDEFRQNIHYTYDFFEMIKDKNISSFGQIDYIVNDYITTTKDNDINNIKDKFTFLKLDDVNSTFVKCDYNMDINGLKSNVSMIFKVGQSQTKSFEFNIKGIE